MAKNNNGKLNKNGKLPDYSLEKKALGQGFCYIAGVDEVGYGCEHPSAEVLTDNGWKHYKDLSSNDLVLSYTDHGTIEWQSINKIIEKEFDGELIELKNRGINILVTPNHYFDVLRRVFKRDKGNGKLKLIGYTFAGRKNVLELKDNDYIPRGGEWVGNSEKYFVLPSIKKLKFDHFGKDYSEKIIPMKIWLKFLGIYLAEGSITRSKNGSYVVSIKQINKNNYLKIREVFNELPFDYFEEKDRLVIRHKQLYDYLKKFGKCYDKFIPREIKNLSSKLLNIFINWMVLGDGSCKKQKNRKKTCVYYTTSKKLKDDFEEILLKAGWTFNTSVRKPRDRYIKGRLIKKENCVPCYETIIRRNNKAQVKFLHKKLLPYKGKVFCLNLSRYHNFYVKRAGTGYFTGNSGAGPVVAAAVIIPNGHVKTLLEAGKIKDSKKLTAKRREEAYGDLIKVCNYGIGIINNDIIDEINILEATRLAMSKAVYDLDNCDYLLIDGRVELRSTISQKQVVKGDNKSISVAAASIIAKVTRDNIMRGLHKKFPIYDWDKNKGYLTAAHLAALKKYGPCLYHRLSYKRVGK